MALKERSEERFEEAAQADFFIAKSFLCRRKTCIAYNPSGYGYIGQDGTIRHVFSCINPQGCRVNSFKTPTEEEKRHDFLWRVYPIFPEKRMFQTFNRSYYEDILFPVVHHRGNA